MVDGNKGDVTRAVEEIILPQLADINKKLAIMDVNFGHFSDGGKERTEAINALRKTIVGDVNGQGLLGQVNLLSQNVNQMDCRLIGIESTLKGNGGGTTGILGRIEKIELFIENRIWIERLVVSSLVVELLGLLYLAVRILASHPIP